MKKLKKRLVKKKRVSKRHRATIKSLALSKVDKKYRRKFLVIQIDGLSITTLRKAMKKGYCNFLSKLVNEKGYEFQEYNCGIPSGTPVVQSAIMYGYNQKIPGFRFVMKDKKKQISFGNPGNVKYIYNKFFRKKKGILRNGSSYFNHFSGGAERAIFTMSHITKNKRFKRINESKLWLIMILNPMAFFRVLYYTLGEFLSEVCEYVWHLFTHFVTKKPAIFSLFNPFRRIFMTAIFQEMITMGVILDIKRGVPKIYMNYIGYDEMGHLRGPRSRPTYVSLRTIDRRIKRIFKSSKRENYDIFINN